MKIATFNINNITKRFSNLAAWLVEAKPDIVCLQELKTEHANFPASKLHDLGYEAVWKGEKSWNGVAILSRRGAPVLTRDILPGDPDDRQSRYIEAAVGGILIASVYLPNGNPQPGPKFTYKLAWFDRLIAHVASLQKADIPVVLAGDFNVVPTAFDIYPTQSWNNDALVQPAVRDRFKRMLEQGWIDALRTLHPDEPMFTFWHYMRQRWERDAGLRLDHFLLSRACAGNLVSGNVDRWVRGAIGASDHAPAWIELDFGKKRFPSRVRS